MLDLLANIRRQPESLRQVSQSLRGAGRRQLESAASIISERKRLVFTGMGGSLYALIPAAKLLARHGILVHVVDASELLYYGAFPEDAVVVALSRSGRTAEVARLASELKLRDMPIVGLTNCPNSPLGESADILIPVAGDLDHGVSIQAYTGGVLTGLYLAASATSTLAGFEGEVDHALRVLDSAMPVWQREVEAWRWEDCRHFYFLARGFSLSSACAATLLMQELARRTATWYNAAEFRQGPVESLRRGHAVAVFAPDGATRHLNEGLAADLRKTGAKVVIVGQDLGVPEYLAPLLQIVPIQLAAYSIAARDQEIPGQFRFAAPVSDREDGLAAG